MHKTTKSFLFKILSSLLMCSFLSAVVVSEESDEAEATSRIFNSSRTLTGVYVRLIQVIEQDQQGLVGEVVFVGECSVCGDTFFVDEGTDLVTPFYEGPLDPEILEDQQFAKAEAIIYNERSGYVSYINFLRGDY